MPDSSLATQSENLSIPFQEGDMEILQEHLERALENQNSIPETDLAPFYRMLQSQIFLSAAHKEPVKFTCTLSVQLEVSFDFFIEEDGSGFHGFSPCMDGLHIDGATPKETFNLLCQGFWTYLRSLRHHNHALRPGPNLKIKANRKLSIDSDRIPIS